MGLRIVNQCYLDELEAAEQLAAKRERDRDPTVPEMIVMFHANRGLASIQHQDGTVYHRDGRVTRKGN
ncbi:hypothetical protein [Paraburkholderia domus]|uniref:hypothetical protein n=1 Tax=Paraburkholderia domus TaxID=2793075 RepID=UPI001B0E4F6C|nr:hypothetical protein [Paraburkholderia domus]CAE6835154.1 hypothetical protein R75483_06883 [Paraburkholderia domus]